MFGKLLQTIFLPKRTRDKLATRSKPERQPAQAPDGQPQAAAGQPQAAAGQPRLAAGRDQLLTEAMTVYRAQMETYESLDAETRRQIEEDAAEAFGEVLAQRNSKEP
jgi:hypothetical protein